MLVLVIAFSILGMRPTDAQASFGSIVEYDQPFTPGPIVVASDGTAWFGEERPSSAGFTYDIGRKALSGPRRDFPVPGVVIALTIGSDGNIWFITYGFRTTGRAAIARMTPTGQLTFFELADKPTAIVTGSDGSIWFNEPRRSMIGRITPPFDVRFNLVEYPAAGQFVGNFMTAGPDGNIWFFSGGYFPYSTYLAKITPAGEISYGLWAVENNSSMVVSADGALWVLDGRSLYRFSTDFTLTLSEGLQSCASAMVGGAHEVWVLCVSQGFNNLLRVDSAGAQDIFQLPEEGYIRMESRGALAIGPFGRSIVFIETAWTEMGLFALQ